MSEDPGDRRQRREGRRRDRALPYALLAPAALILGLVLGYPLVRLVLISVQDYGLRALFTGVTTWNGAANYRAVLVGGQFGTVLLRTLIERTTRDVTGRIVEFARSIYRGDRYRITSKLRFDSSSG